VAAFLARCEAPLQRVTEPRAALAPLPR
jgi:hypothetical protein